MDLDSRSGDLLEPELEQGSSGQVRMDERTHRVWVGDLEVELSPTEWTLLAALFRAKGGVVTPAELIDAAWGHASIGRHVLEVNLSRLRAKLGEPAEGGLIRTVRGYGYALDLKRP